MTAGSDTELFTWLQQAQRYGGSFIKTIAQAAIFADDFNYAIIRPVLLELKAKYPKYSKETA